MEVQRAQRAVLLNIALNEIIMKSVLNIDASSSESESEMEILYMMQFSRLRGKRKKGVRIEGYINDVVPRFTTHQFKEHFRMTPNCFQLLENKFGLMLSKHRTGRPFISPRVQLLATIWLLATPDSYRSVGLKFNLAKSSLSHCVRRVVLILCKMSIDVIKWPSVHDMNTITEKFKKISGLKDVVGAIDGTHIEIPAPAEPNTQCYLTRKCRYAVTLQAICNADLSFIDCYAGYPGSVSDIRVFRNSDFWHNVCKNYRYFFPNKEFIIGDKAHPIRKWCLTAYRDNGHLTEIENNFNHILSQTRQTIERAFALLKEGRDNDEAEENFERNENEQYEDHDDEGVARRNYIAINLYRRRI